ncbi:MAG: alpha/beta hydrolase [Candidatus Binatia bacterium]|nr:alpha/beta hydrolase [Candidatus Binatia bacterium]
MTSFRAVCSAAALAALVVACGDADPPPIRGFPAALPEALSGLDATFHEAIPYGPFGEENLFDILLPNDRGEAPIVIYFHGGGFRAGSRGAAWGRGRAGGVERLIDAGVAVASADYRLIRNPEEIGVIKSLRDSARCLQFIRLHAEELGVDPERIVLMGASAGAGTSLWIGSNDDLAQPDSDDLVLRQSTRVRGVVLLETQATYDIARWSSDVFPDFGIGVLEGAALLGLEGQLLAFYGISELDQFESPEILEYRRSVDMIDLLTADDPPIFVRNQNQPDEPPLRVNVLFHHANHALVVANRAQEVGVEHVLYAPVLGIEDPSGEDEVDFALRMLAE